MLKELQEVDIKLKQDIKKERSHQQSQSVDFHEQNIISYCYNIKENKSKKLRDKNDLVQKLMADQFSMTSLEQKQFSLGNSQDITESRFLKEQSKIQERKQQELEVKLFQEHQMALKKQRLQREEQQKI